jgi:hypothetical protein
VAKVLKLTPANYDQHVPGRCVKEKAVSDALKTALCGPTGTS